MKTQNEEILAEGLHWKIVQGAKPKHISLRFFCRKCSHQIVRRQVRHASIHWFHVDPRTHANHNQCFFCNCSDAHEPTYTEISFAMEKLAEVQRRKSA